VATNLDPQESDYILPDSMSSCWLTVGNISVYVVRNDEGVSVDLYQKQAENNDESLLASCWALYPVVEEHEVPSEKEGVLKRSWDVYNATAFDEELTYHSDPPGREPKTFYGAEGLKKAAEYYENLNPEEL
jgi:hypothetical protein